MDCAPIPVETLLAHREWVRAVAVAVVRDPNAADDVEQETWLAALSTPPRHASSLRGWFGAVARSRARRIGRTDARRDARETAAARRENSPSAAELAELADTHRRVVQAVVELDEPYRGTILLRYFEGLSVEDVAARTSVPLDTARSRISRGLAKLRERLSRELGTDDRPWAMTLVPLIAGPKGTAGGATAAGGGVVMASTKTMAAVVGALLLVGVGAVLVPKWTSSDEKSVAVAPDAAPAPAPKPEAQMSKPVAPPRVQRPRAKEEAPAPPPAEESKPRAASETVMERLSKSTVAGKWQRVPIPEVLAEIAAKTGVEIVVSAEADALWTPAKVGWNYEMELNGASGNHVLDLVTQMKGLAYVIEEPRVVIVPKGVTRDPTKPVIALPPWTPPLPITVLGRVVDADGAIVVGAEIVHVSRGDRAIATTDVAGRYEVKLTKPYGSLEARAPGQVPSPAVSVDGQPGAQVTCDLATGGAGGTVWVHVVSDAGKLARVEVCVGPRQDVRVDRPDGRPAVQRARQALTDAQGAATFPGIAPGEVVVTARLAQYESAERKVTVEAGKHVDADFRLVKKPSLAERLATKRVSLNSPGLRMSDILGYLHTLTGVVIVIDPALAETARNASITLTIADRPLEEVVRALCAQLGNAKYELHDEDDCVWLTVDKR